MTIQDDFYPDEGGNPFINLTPHEIALVNENGTISRIPPSGEVARVKLEYFPSDFDCFGVEIAEAVQGRVEGLPSPQEGKVYLVSAMVAQAASIRADVLAPDTGKTAIRDAKGQITAVTRLLRYAPMVHIAAEEAHAMAEFIASTCAGHTMGGSLPPGYDDLSAVPSEPPSLPRVPRFFISVEGVKITPEIVSGCLAEYYDRIGYRPEKKIVVTET